MGVKSEQADLVGGGVGENRGWGYIKAQMERLSDHRAKQDTKAGGIMYSVNIV